MLWFSLISIRTYFFSSPATRHGGAWGERRYSSYSFSTSTLDGGVWLASRPGRAFTPGERTPGTHCTGGWVGLRAGLDTETTGKILCPRRESNPDRPVVQPVVRHYTAWANPAPIRTYRDKNWNRPRPFPFTSALMIVHGTDTPSFDSIAYTLNKLTERR
jgi:hypothetical protein